MPLERREERGKAFDASADDYEAARPSYPDEAIADIVEIAGLSESSRILEVGVGTGQATRKFGPLGCEIVGLEPGPRLAEAARQALAAFDNISILNNSFENYEGLESFDLILSATAFHWTDPQTRWQRVTKLLKSGGHIAILTNKSMEKEENTLFYQAAQPLYKEVVLERGEKDPKNTTILVAKDLGSELHEDKDFNVVLEKSYRYDLVLDAGKLIQLHKTFSDHLLMKEENRNWLFAGLRKLIDEDFGGKVVKPYETEVVVAQLGIASP